MKISVITVTFNSSKYIRTCLNSVRAQTYPDIEHIIVDGGSADETLEIVKSYKHIDFVLSEPDDGVYDAMNKGIAMATGDLICFLNSDDFYLYDDVVQDVVDTFALNFDAEMVLGNVDYVQPNMLLQPVRFYSSFYFSPWKMRFGFMPAHPATFVKRSVYENTGNYNLGYKISADFEWFVRALLIGRSSYVKLNKTLVRMRVGGLSTAGLKATMIISREILKALDDNSVCSNYLLVCLRLPIKLFQKTFSCLTQRF